MLRAPESLRDQPLEPLWLRGQAKEWGRCPTSWLPGAGLAQGRIPPPLCSTAGDRSTVGHDPDDHPRGRLGEQGERRLFGGVSNLKENEARRPRGDAPGTPVSGMSPGDDIT